MIIEFDKFISLLRDELKKPLPGNKAQFKMAPYERILKAATIKLNPNPKLSAVLILFYPVSNNICTMLILRNTYKGVHSAQIGFPGGKMEAGDADLEATALREAHEEVGVKPNQVEIIGKLSDLYIPPSGYLVQPYIGYTNDKPNFIRDENEVAQLIEVSADTIMDESIVGKKKIQLGGSKLKIKYPFFDVNGHTVWGATAMMISELKAVIKNSQ